MRGDFEATQVGAISIDALTPGTILIVHTHNSRYRIALLDEPRVALVEGGAQFQEPTVVRLEGATVGPTALKMGWILVGFPIEMQRGFARIRSSPVRAVSIAAIPCE